MGYSGLIWVIPGYYGLFRVIMGLCRTGRKHIKYKIFLF